MTFFQDAKTLTIPALGSVDYELPALAPLDNLTVWAIGPQPTNAITAQATIGDGPVNTVAFGGAVVIPNSGAVNEIVFLGNDPTDGRRLIPQNTGPSLRRPFTFKVNFAAGAVEERVTVYATANELVNGA